MLLEGRKQKSFVTMGARCGCFAIQDKIIIESPEQREHDNAAIIRNSESIQFSFTPSFNDGFFMTIADTIPNNMKYESVGSIVTTCWVSPKNTEGPTTLGARHRFISEAALLALKRECIARGANGARSIRMVVSGMDQFYINLQAEAIWIPKSPTIGFDGSDFLVRMRAEAIQISTTRQSSAPPEGTIVEGYPLISRE